MKGSRILIVDDNRDNMELIRFLVEQSGHQVITARHGKEGLHLAQQHHPDLILLDLAMPELDGWEVARELKADPLTRDIPLIAITAYAMPGNRRKALDSGFDDYITKPLHIPSFGEQIDRFLENDQESEALGENPARDGNSA
jgi:two-component system cell cycle response regulator DivK